MRIGVLSDTHDQVSRTEVAVTILRTEGATILIHCGDIIGKAVLQTCSELPCYFVFGNHDADNVPELRQASVELEANCLGWGDVMEFAGKSIGVTHGHLTTDVKRLLVSQPDYLLSGHLHEPRDWIENGVRRINPGALHDAEEYTVCVIDLQTDEVRHIRVME